jgi:predicted DNA-binding transcriptional regulator AlpA
VTEPEYMTAPDLEGLTGTPESTWRYWAHVDAQRSPGDQPLGPPSFKLGRRRVWKRTSVLAWLESQEKAATA